MKRLVERIEGLEKSVELLVQKLSAVKDRNKILSEENERLIYELNQLKRGTDQGSHAAEKINNSESDIKVEELRQELDQCINEVESCLKML